MKDQIKELVENVIKSKVIVKEAKYSSENKFFPDDFIFNLPFTNDEVIGLDKETFVNIIKELKIVQDKENFLEDETGVYLPGIRAHYIEVIFSLLNAIFTPTQVELISYYLYEQKSLKKTKGKVTIDTGKKKQVVDISDPEKLWEALELFEEED